MARRFVTLRIWHPGCWMLELCERCRDVSVESRGVNAHGGHVHADALVRAPDAASLERALACATPPDVHREILHVGVDHAEVYSNYPGYRSLYERTLQSGLLVVGSITHVDGYERWEVLAEGEGLDKALASLREVAEVRVERISEARPASPPGGRESLLGRLADELSERQYELLRRAVTEGYYDWPRGKNVKRMAQELGISGPTCLEHIRRAESRIVPSVVRELERLRGQPLLEE